MKQMIDMCQQINDTKIPFVLNPDNVWGKFDASLIPVVNGVWNEVKFLNDNCDGLHSSMSTLPNNKGGIYVFIAKPNIIPNSHIYILYIGRALSTDQQNLRKRCRTYLSDERPKIYKMKYLWGKNLYIRYLPLTDNSLIERLEKELINAIIPPCNDDYPDKVLRMAMKAAF